jgi:superfamily II DNA or RNA helicase
MARKKPRSSATSSLTPAASSVGQVGTSPVDELIEQGLRAIKEYDYELARTTLTRAFERSEGAARAARALLVLLVDHLAADHEALELGDRLSREAQASPDVQFALALAAARSGAQQRARGHLARLDGTPAAEVLVVLAEAALAAGALDEAARLCDEARSHDQVHPGMQQVARRLAQSREDMRRPLEAAIDQLLAEGQLEDAARLATQLLARFPESAVARRAVRVALEQQRAGEAERLVKDAEGALAQVDLGVIRASFHAARVAAAAAPPNEALNLRLTTVESEIAARELDAKISDTVRRLADPHPRAGLTHYASLPPDVRRRVRGVAGLLILDDLEHLLDRRSEPEGAVTAVLAFVEATSSAELDPEVALQKLAAHERALVGLDAASRLAAQLRQRIRDERQRKLSDLLATVRCRLDAGDAAAALELLGKITLRELESGERESVETLRTNAKALLETRELEASYERLLQAFDPLAAREVAERLLARASESERAGRQGQIAAAMEAARRLFGVWASQVGDDAAEEHETSHSVEMGAPLNITEGRGAPVPWLDAAAQSLVLLECCNHWIFIQLVDLAVGRVRTCAVIWSPEPLNYVTTAISRARTLTIAAPQGVLELSLDTWDPLSWRSRRALAIDGISESIEIAPESRFVWTQSTHDIGTTGRTRVVDLERGRVVREMSDGSAFWPLVGASEPTMAFSRRGTTLSLHHPGGVPVEGGRIELAATICHALVHPSEGQWLVFIREGGDGQRLGFMEVDATARASAPIWLDDVHPGRPWSCATSLVQRTSFVVAVGGDGNLSLHALRAERPLLQVERVYRASIPGGIRLARDPSSRHVVALVPDHERLHIVPLGPEPPVFPSFEPETKHLDVPGFNAACTFTITLGEEHDVAVRELRTAPERSAMAWMQRRLAAAGTDVVELLEIYHVLHDVSQPTVLENFLCRMTDIRPSDPHIAALRALEYARAKRWAEVRQMLEGVDLQALLPAYRQHAHHIFGLALLQAGAFERALNVIEEGHRTTKGSCQLKDLLEVIRDRNDSCSPLGLLRAAIGEADACLVREDLAGARAAIDRRIVWQGGEVQSLARLAEVELRAEPDRALGRFRKALALARFLDAHRMFAEMRKDLPLQGTSWSAPRIADLETRAQAWLDHLGAPDAPSEGSSAPAVENPAPVPAPEWSLALNELDAALEAMAVDESPTAPARLAFRVRHAGRKFEGIDVLLQKSLRNGRFSPGQLADAGELLAAANVLTDEADAAAVVVLTEGISHAPRSRPSPSRARFLRLLATLVGHPRVFLVDRPADPVRVEHARLGLELVGVAGGLIPRFILGGARWTADELLAHMESTVVIGVDAEALVITLAPLDAAVLALVQALQRHPSVFPEESHRELRRRLGALQHAIELHLPETLAGNAQKTDSRPVVRLTLEDDAGLIVEIGVRPVPGAVFGPPGEGSRLALGAVDGLHVSARRDLARERASAERLPALLTLDAATREGRWRYRLNGEERILAVVEALAELGTEVVVEWPKDARAWRWVGRATPRELRVHVGRKGDLLSIEGDVEIDGHRVALATLLEAIAQGRRYVVVGPQRFIGLTAELRERLEAAAELLHAGREGLETGLAAAPVLADLEDEQRATDAAWRSLRERTAAARTLDPGLPAGLHADLRPYQLEGFCWLARLSAWAAGACLADDMGLGKTVQTLALLVHRAALGPALVIAPISVTSGWISEAARFAPGLRVLPYRGTDREALLSEARPGDLFIAGYGVVTRDLEALAGVRFSTLVLDEAHLIKNVATRRARAVGQLQADFRVALTGTPVENHLGELWNLFRVISPGLLGTWPQFRERFAAPIERDQSAERRAALGRVLRPFMLRRTKESVLPELPPLTELNRLVSLSAAERELYETARLAATTAITAPQTPNQRFAVLGWLTRLRRLSCHPRLFHDAWTGAASKLDAFLALVEELRATGHRALVFSQFTDHLALVREALRARGVSTIYLDGSTPLDERAQAVESFQRGEGDLFLISLKAGGTGLNLTAADHVIHLDPWWNPAVEDQATDRAHRIGQSRPVTVIRLIAQGTIEEAVLALHAEKRELAERLLEGTDVVGRLSADELVDLVRRGTMSANPVEVCDEDEQEIGPEPAS